MGKLTLLITVLIMTGCRDRAAENQIPENYFEDLTSWKQNRDERLRSPTGWVNLVGLYWLKEGENTFGSNEDNDVVFPEYAHGNIGTITLTDSILSYEASAEVDVIVDSTIQAKAVVYDAGNEIFRPMQWERYRWFIIERSGNYGIRLRDLESEYMYEPMNISYYEWSEEWRVNATYREFEEPLTLSIDNIVGYSFDEEFEGEFVFEIDGEMYSLLPSLGEESSFIMFADVTSGDETYGAGRYLVAGLPDENNKVIIDFNKAYNPPCAFTDFATCPLPPMANILGIPVRAGEMEFHFSSEAH